MTETIEQNKTEQDKTEQQAGCTLRYALRAGVASAGTSDGEVQLIAWPHAESLGRIGADGRALLRALAAGGCAPEEFAGLESLRDTLHDGGWLTITVRTGGVARYTLEPFRSPAQRPVAAARPVLSRYAVLRRRHGDFVLESPRAWCDVRVHDGAVLAALDALDNDDSAAAGDLLDRLRADLQWAGMACPADAEDGELRLRQWSPHELWFHERSRLGHRGGFGEGFGGTFWARDTFDPPPARHPAFTGDSIELSKPDLAALRRDDPTLTTVLEDRHSVREHDEAHPVTAEQLGEFLYRCARTRLVRELDGFEYTSRPHPAGGSAYELELYPVVRNVPGLAPGMYHYDSLEHRLRLIRPPEHRAVRRLQRVAAVGAVGGDRPQVLIVLGARVGRLMWKYEAMPYALILKHVGVLYQTMYCVATAMGLAACALGSGDASAFTEATDLDPLSECSVGEFILGGHPAEVPRWAVVR